MPQLRNPELAQLEAQLAALKKQLQAQSQTQTDCPKGCSCKCTKKKVKQESTIKPKTRKICECANSAPITGPTKRGNSTAQTPVTNTAAKTNSSSQQKSPTESTESTDEAQSKTPSENSTTSEQQKPTSNVSKQPSSGDKPIDMTKGPQKSQKAGKAKNMLNTMAQQQGQTDFQADDEPQVLKDQSK
eukprot:CAMPEP_0116990146 /NCGR_PEP_ID=MMETSP0467-20121206/65285_1 /TAXON_ID=283647 /ORGANISM="Mesodinium pulex, Strain SPMC105" /LENGTH=186 /DNA_ID=CAMNT_0004686815 /DNA_START=305 /DNA_END=866 /DNA_ORIENTATION=+